MSDIGWIETPAINLTTPQRLSLEQLVEIACAVAAQDLKNQCALFAQELKTLQSKVASLENWKKVHEDQIDDRCTGGCCNE